MRFAYTYRSSDGRRHAAEIEAESRDAAFAAIRRELGVKPIRVTAAEGGSRQGGGSPDGGAGGARFRAAAWGAAILAAAVLGGVAWWLRSPRHAAPGTNGEPPAAGGETPADPRPQAAGDGRPIVVTTPQGPVTYAEARPLPRQAIPGDRRRINEALGGPADRPGGGVFRSAAERWLARFAEPGRISPAAANGADGGNPPPRPSEAEFSACLKEPVRIASSDFTEVVDLKRIVAGMKREMGAYLAGGGTAGDYLVELEKRQRLEVSYRERAEQKLGELLAAANGQAPRSAGDDLKAAYAYWLKANAHLQAMGIYPLALPDALRSYQMGLDIEE